MSREIIFDSTTGTTQRKAELEPVRIKIKTANNTEIEFVLPKKLADMI